MEKLCWLLILEQVKQHACIGTKVYGLECNSKERTFLGFCVDLDIPEPCRIGFDTKHSNNNLYVYINGEKLFKVTIETHKLMGEEISLIKNLQIINR